MGLRPARVSLYGVRGYVNQPCRSCEASQGPQPEAEVRYPVVPVQEAEFLLLVRFVGIR